MTVAVSNAAHVHVVEPGRRSRKASTRCVLGDDLTITYSRLEDYCFRNLRPVEIDLLIVAGAVAYADRRVRRRSGIIWPREIGVTVPVHEKEVWNQPRVMHALTEVLHYATGDYWEIDFTQRRRVDERAQQLPLFRQLDKPPDAILAYSAGLDSFAQLQLLLADDQVPFLITSEHHSHVRKAVLASLQGQRPHSVGIPMRFSHDKRADETYRTRTFSFLAAATVAALTSGARRIVIGENGQGSIGPMLVWLASEWPYRATYPALTLRFRRFVNALLEEDVQVEHPQLWCTKAEALQKVREAGRLAGWHHTRSCSRNMKRAKTSEAPNACGLCGNCLLRVVSLEVLGLADKDEPYFSDLTGSSLSHVWCRRGKPVSNGDQSLAQTAVLDLEFLAREVSEGRMRQVAVECAQATVGSPQVALLKLRRLLAQHATEWNAFLDALPQNSWIVQTARGQ